MPSLVPRTLLVTTWFTIAAASDPRFVTGGSRQVVVDGPWRFTSTTARLIRIEYDSHMHFVDEPTIAFLRSAPIGFWESISSHGEWEVLNTSMVSLWYKKGSAPSGSTLFAISRPDGQYKWTWGDDPADGNLRGTARTLDSSAETLDLNCHNKVSPTMNNSEMHCAWGLVSRKGWALVNDTGAPMWRDGWFAPSRNSVDVSLFLHGLDFTGALKDFFHASGPPALPPRYALGTMFTRWFNFDSDSVQALINDFESRSMPLDAWIFDMNWHLYGPWGSFTWNKDSYPQLQDTLAWIQAKRLHIGANTHDQSGIAPEEATYKEFCAALGRQPCTDKISFDLYNKTYAMAQEDIAVRAIDTKNGQQGIDFSWIDYQQGESDHFENTRIPNINPTIVLNMLRAKDPKRHGENRRPMVLSRWGGLGNHRYPVGFSGDQMHSWKGLAFLPYFTSTAANVAFNFWSHDTVGGDRELAEDYELSVRWVQTSAWSPVLRFHDKGAGTGDCAKDDVCAKILPWDLPNSFFMAVRQASQYRDELLPYIYTAAFNSSSSGLALVRPMYYEDPTDEALYDAKDQYLFGPDMIISPITSPSGPDAKGFKQALGVVSWRVRAPRSPPGSKGWVDRLDGDFAFASSVAEAAYGIFDVPGLVRQGAVIPMRPRLLGEGVLARAMQPLNSIEFRIMPAEAFYKGAAFSNQGRVVDDDGLSQDYLAGKYASTLCEYSFQGRTFKIKLSQTGDFTGRPQRVTLRLSFPQLPPLTILQTASLSEPVVTYSHELLGTVLTFEGIELTANPSLEVAIDPAYSARGLQNFIGLQGRVRRARYAKDALDVANTPYGDGRAKLTAITLAATHMSPNFAETLPQVWEDALAEVTSLLSNDKGLNQDFRRVRFVSEILGIKAPSATMSLVI